MGKSDSDSDSDSDSYSDSDSDSEFRRDQELRLQFREEELTWFERESKSRYGEEWQTRHIRERKATTEEQKKSCEAINTVLNKMIQLPESKQICGDHDVDHEFVTEVLKNLENCISQLTLSRLAKAKRDQLALAKRDPLARAKRYEQAKRVLQLKLEMEKNGYLEIADDEIPASKKTRYSGL